ncbi:caspase family protein [Chitinophaga silvisoli]|uniref:Caspase family protein n=1 Tax=Chitinophaga silvisoli TaxID=2291814 RepID=A0A3E1NXY0_9BACT|nr:hypothetical protein [Chitinophaga silvisoli]RFM32783.1 hypothetical protein DXN04_24260 [Chitinophaga silvisoli]
MFGKVKHIVVIQSLKGERLTGQELYQDTIRRRIDFKGLDFTHNYHDVTSNCELKELLKQYADQASAYKDGIVIHLEMHGDHHLKGLYLSNGDLITWEELVDLFRIINIGTQNNLYITMGTCNGRYLYKGANLLQKSPYAAFISASKEVTNDQVFDDFTKLYETLLANGNLIDAYLELEKAGTEFFYKDSRTVTEEAIGNVMETLLGKANLKSQVINNMIKETERLTGKRFTPQEAEAVFKVAIINILEQQKSTFDFNNQ